MTYNWTIRFAVFVCLLILIISGTGCAPGLPWDPHLPVLSEDLPRYEHKPTPETIELNNRANRLRDKDPDEAIRLLDKAIKAHPNCLLSYVNKANTLIGEKKYKEAAEVVTKAIEIAPRNPNGHMTLGLLMQKMGNTKEAVEAFRYSIAVSKLLLKERPKNFWGLLQIATAYYKAGDRNRAMACIEYIQDIGIVEYDKDGKMVNRGRLRRKHLEGMLSSVARTVREGKPLDLWD